MNRDRVWVEFMLEHAERLAACRAAGCDAFLSTAQLQDAAIRGLQVLADTSIRLSPHLLEQHPEVEWHWLRALRNMLVHEPLNIDPAWLWDALEYDLPLLEQALQGMLPE